jgi:hypothetical protein
MIGQQLRKCAEVWWPTDPEVLALERLRQEQLAARERERKAEKLRLEEMERAESLRALEEQELLNKVSEQIRLQQEEAERLRQRRVAVEMSALPAPSAVLSLAPPSQDFSTTTNSLETYSSSDCSFCQQELVTNLQRLQCGHLFHTAWRSAKSPAARTASNFPLPTEEIILL